MKHLNLYLVFVALQVLVDGPLTGVPRQEYRLNNLHLTKYRIKFPYTAPTRIVRKAWTESDLKAQWKVSPWSVKAQNICKVCTESRSRSSNFRRDGGLGREGNVHNKSPNVELLHMMIICLLDRKCQLTHK